jgi:cytochrome c-type biogenesis protein CcmE
VQTAHEMFRKRKTSQNIGSETMEGLVTTEGQRARLGGVAGVVFEGSIESDEGQFTASFLMADHLLDRRRLPRAVWNKL